MKYPAYHIEHEGELEVYKMQTSLFSSDGIGYVLIYNEDRTQQLEEFKPNNVKVLKEFMGKGVIKCYAIGFQNDNGQIQLVEKINDQKYYF